MATNLRSTPQFDEVHVISDLHLGGRAGFQMFNQGPRLARTIEGLAKREAKSVALVLNGDVFDFLAEEPVPPSGLDPLGALEKVARIVEQDSAFAEVFLALRAFLARDGRHLVVVLGNHDVELAFAHVRYWLSDWLVGDAAGVRGRLTWAVDGSGYACEIGNKRVLCLHGNEVDSWNVVDYRALLNVARALNRGQPPPEWEPNAGTRMVIEVMNGVKRAHPFVDLLKPETRAAVPVVVAIDPAQLGAIGRVLRLSSKRAIDGIRMTAGFLGGEPVREEERPSEGEALAVVLREVMEEQPEMEAMKRALRIQRMIAGIDSESQADAGAAGQFLGFSSWVRDTGKPKALRLALKRWLVDDRTFELDDADDQFSALDAMVGRDVHYLIAGHTHLRRALQRKAEPGRFYFNTGTWTRLVRIPSEALNDQAAFDRMYLRLAAGNLAELDGAYANGKPLVKIVATVASVVVSESGGAVGMLYEADLDGTLHEVPQSRFPSGS